MTKNETKDSDLPCHTMDPRVGGGGGLNWMEQGKFKTLSRLFAAPLLEIEYCSSLRAGPGFVGLFIGQYYWCRLA
jgi:hypothetical protein